MTTRTEQVDSAFSIGNRDRTVRAADEEWDLATTLYMAKKLDKVAAGRTLSVLDVACGDGRTTSLLHRYGHALHGVELPEKGRRAQP